MLPCSRVLVQLLAAGFTDGENEMRIQNEKDSKMKKNRMKGSGSERSESDAGCQTVRKGKGQLVR